MSGCDREERNNAMKAISLWQPWASLIATGAKTIETRSWSTNYRGPLAIHAAKTWNQELDAMICEGRIQGGLAPLVGKPLGHTWPGVHKKDLPFGCVVAICDLVDCIPTAEMTQTQVFPQRFFGDFTPGRYGWVLANVRRIEPIPAIGRQGFWDWSPPEGVS